MPTSTTIAPRNRKGVVEDKERLGFFRRWRSISTVMAITDAPNNTKAAAM
jgi:hypothetical protein